MPEHMGKMDKAQSLLMMEADTKAAVIIAGNISSCSIAIKRCFKKLEISVKDFELLEKNLKSNFLFFLCLNKKGDFLNSLKNTKLYNELSEDTKNKLESLKGENCLKITNNSCPVREEAENIKKFYGDIK